MGQPNSKKAAIKKSKALAVSSLICGLVFWIPLLNLIFGALAIYLGIKSLNKIKKDPAHYGGKPYAIIGIALGAMVYTTYIIGFGICLSGYKDVCKSVGLAYLA